MKKIALHIALATLAAATVIVQAQAQQHRAATPVASGNKGPPNAVQGFSKNREKPIQIEARRLEVRDKDKVATFYDSVQVIQGDTELRCKTLTVHYEKEDEKSTKSAATTNALGPDGAQKIRKLEAKGGVVVTQNDQVATGDSALFEMATNTVTMMGNVVVTQGQNVLRGDRLVVDLTTGLSRVESGKGPEGRVQGLFVPGGGGPSLPGKPDGARPENFNPLRR
ncbi:MAG: LPS ABC transporter substrate-binding protein LptA [Pseudolabrys sp.]|nr:LPS ABC transporter substrate-binding protein LptA [Pseudolabrys sp.]